MKHTHNALQKAKSLRKVASQFAKSYEPVSKTRTKRLSLLIHFDANSGYDAVAPLFIALKKKQYGLQTAFARQAIIEAAKQMSKTPKG